MTPSEITTKLLWLSEISKNVYAYIERDPAGIELIKLCNQLPKKPVYLNTLKDKYENDIRTAEPEEKHVNRVRAKVFRLIQEGQVLTAELLENIKREIQGNPESRSFRSWTNSRILFPAYYWEIKEEVEQWINRFANQIKADLDLYNFSKKVNDFIGPTNFGDHKAWFCFYNDKFEEKDRFQLFFEIDQEQIRYGLYINPKKKKDEKRRLTYKRATEFNYEDLKSQFQIFRLTVETNNDNSNSAPGPIGDEVNNNNPPVDGNKEFPAELRTFNGSINPNIILYGPPGTGKTFKTIDLAANLFTGKIGSVSDVLESHCLDHDENNKLFQEQLNKNIFFITFHQNYSYEEFLGGLRPDTNTLSNGLTFKWTPGLFLKACAAAHFAAINKFVDFNSINEDQAIQVCKEFIGAIQDAGFQTSKYKTAGRVILVIDEINRANISRVFGELITLIEEDKRLGGEHQMSILLPNGKRFGVPANLVIVGTMNTADKSIALIDVALRRRFEFFDLYPTADRVSELVTNPLYAEILNKLNELVLKEKKSLDFMIGYSFFMGSDRKLDYIFNYKIIPLLTEYFNNKLDDVQKILTGLDSLLKDSEYKVEGIVDSKNVRTELLRVVKIKKANNSNIEEDGTEKVTMENSVSEVED